MLKIIGAIIWVAIIGIWYCWPGRQPVEFNLTRDDVLMLVLIMCAILNFIGTVMQRLESAELKRRQEATDKYLDDLAEAWITDDDNGYPDGGGEPAAIQRDNVVRLVRGRKA